ncbi:hypothetical protein [Mycobacterium sp.]|uniref:hypothetical protein n=1 Tax=Mycobacterium sp. TaxID=1785 RepID=UPI003F99585B
MHGDNVAMGYWQKHHESERTFRARLLAPSPGTPEGPWLRTGDLGFFSDAELFIMGRIRDLLIVDGPNRYPGKVPISAPSRHTDKLVAIGDQRRDVSREDPTDPRGRFSDFLPSRATPPKNGESIPYKMFG